MLVVLVLMSDTVYYNGTHTTNSLILSFSTILWQYATVLNYCCVSQNFYI